MYVRPMSLVSLLGLAALAALVASDTTNSMSLLVKPKSPVILSKTFEDNMIVGGEITVACFMASIQLNNFQHCGASILNRTHVLTAAHCAEEHDVKKYVVRVGSNSWKTGGQVLKVSNIVRHPNFNPKTLDYDAAVLKVGPRMVFSKSVCQVTLAKPNTAIKTGMKVQPIGWGSTKAGGGSSSDVLKRTTLQTIGNSDCEMMYESMDLKVTPRMFCAAGERTGDCVGDSGGPVYEPTTKTQVGIISWGMGCGQMMEFGSVFARVSELYNFITGKATGVTKRRKG